MTDLTLSDVVMPWEPGLHPSPESHMAQAELAARACGLLETDADLRRFRAFVRLDMFAFPYAPLDRLAAVGANNHWLYFIDDTYDDHPEVGHDLKRVEELMRRAFKVLESGWLPPKATPLEKFTAHLRAELTTFASDAWMERFLGHTRDYLFRGSLPSMELWVGGGPVSAMQYLDIRQHDSAMYSAIDCSALAAGLDLPANILGQPLIRELELRTVRHVALLNDVFSYQKEVLQQGYPCNLVHVLAREKNLSLEIAVGEAIAMVNDELKGFMRAEAALGDCGPVLAAYLQGMKSWMRGNYDYSIRSKRFRAPDSPFAELRRTRTISLEIPAAVLPPPQSPT